MKYYKHTASDSILIGNDVTGEKYHQPVNFFIQDSGQTPIPKPKGIIEVRYQTGGRYKGLWYCTNSSKKRVADRSPEYDAVIELLPLVLPKQNFRKELEEEPMYHPSTGNTRRGVYTQSRKHNIEQEAIKRFVLRGSDPHAFIAREFRKLETMTQAELEEYKPQDAPE